MNAKRIFDLCLVIPGLVILSPLMLLIAWWVKMESPGPALFKQQRVGLNGKTFNVLKFRTMKLTQCNTGLKITVGSDPRITRAGLFLRQYKLDELPQLINVLKGEMSLVGPRPEVPEYVAEYPVAVRSLVLSVLPGITDHASIEFRDENAMLASAEDPHHTYVHDILPVKLGYYTSYVKNRTLLSDLCIIIKTLGVVFK